MLAIRGEGLAALLAFGSATTQACHYDVRWCLVAAMLRHRLSGADTQVRHYGFEKVLRSGDAASSPF